MQKRTLSELKLDPFVKSPRVAWLLDRKLTYVGTFLIATVATGSFLLHGWQAYQHIITPEKIESPYLDVVGVESPGVSWLNGFVQYGYELSDWQVQETMHPSHSFMSDVVVNKGLDVPLTMLASKSAQGSEVKLFAQVYGAGQARQQFDKYVELLKERNEVEAGKLDQETGVVSAVYSGGFLLVSGDVIVGVVTPSVELRNQLLQNVASHLTTSLRESGCLDLSGENGVRRSPFYNESSFTGLLKEQTVESQVKIDRLPTVNGVVINDVVDTSVQKPEEPLPSGLPGALPEAPQKPGIPVVPGDRGDFAGKAVYQVADSSGPGCGWAWTGQKPLVFNESDLKFKEQNEVIKVQNQVNDSAQDYVDGKVYWARGLLTSLPEVDKWNLYVKSVNEIHAKWLELEHRRNELKPLWDSYVADYRSWVTFDERKSRAKQEYDTAVKTCERARSELATWESEWGEEPLKKKIQEWEKKKARWKPGDPQLEPKPTAPEKPSGCDSDPVKPDILEQEKPSKPEAPAVPAGVTIPNSWEKPE